MREQAWRRHQDERIKNKRASNTHAGDGKSLSIAVNTPARCSCWMCGNPRKFFGDATVQERSFLELSRRHLGIEGVQEESGVVAQG